MTARLNEVPSPCVNVCQIDAKSDLCLGCRRTLQEIADWLDMTPDEKLATLERVSQRTAPAGNP
jgi:predicted Fe-S protein YdhL (DUF1289 family)